ncbi:MAG: hypothetical protein KKC85_00955 [Gammaproteobacteria bacterium]|nr:hypothetical protein [Gammaproteobacteria bacterium]MBU1441671.1 hypothetical protein [Gammaproteobacteria bacterium]MBU2284986.1 hypothetical protein [Gammaproteobacteria bacterium]
MNRIRIVGTCFALGGLVALGGCVGVPGPGYDPYYGDVGPTVVPGPSVYIDGGYYHDRPYYGGPRYYGQPGYYGRPGYRGDRGDRRGDYRGPRPGVPPFAGGGVPRGVPPAPVPRSGIGFAPVKPPAWSGEYNPRNSDKP